MKFSYGVGKMIRCQSILKYKSYQEYAKDEVARISREISPVQSVAPQKGTLRDLAIDGDGIAFINTLEKWLQSGVDVEPNDWALYAKICVDEGEPARLLATAQKLDCGVWQIGRFRTYLFIAALMAHEYAMARRLAAETLSGYATNKRFLLRIVGESYLLQDAEITKAAISQLISHFRQELSRSELIYLYNTALYDVGESFFWGIAEPNSIRKKDQNTLIFQSNVARRRDDYLGQVRYYNALLDRYGLTRVVLIDENQPLSVVNVRAESPSGPLHGPLVTVLMSSFNSSATIISALEALTYQSYRNLEILVADDCSTDDTVEKVRRYADERDDRVRVYQMNVNGGTYRARNYGLANATGTYFTCLDSDDWAHPQRIATLVEFLETSPSHIAARSHLLRLSVTNGFKPHVAGYIHEDMSSLLFRREEVIEKVGYYRPVRTGADSEFIERLSVAFGAEAMGVISKPLLLADWTESSLSGSPITGITRGGTMSSGRLRFRSEFRREHRAGRLHVPLDDRAMEG